MQHYNTGTLVLQHMCKAHQHQGSNPTCMDYNHVLIRYTPALRVSWPQFYMIAHEFEKNICICALSFLANRQHSTPCSLHDNVRSGKVFVLIATPQRKCAHVISIITWLSPLNLSRPLSEKVEWICLSKFCGFLQVLRLRHHPGDD